MSGVIDVITGQSGRDAASASIAGSELAAQGQTDVLNYIQETEALPQQYRQDAMSSLAGLYGLEGGEGNQQQFIDQAMNSPLYQQMVGNIGAGEEAIARTASATGGFRSGGFQENLADYTTSATNEALTTSYNQQLQGITGLANMPSATPMIAQAMGAPSQTLAQGQIGAAQAIQQQNQSQTEMLAGLGGAYMMSDIRLKDNIEYIGEKNGHSWFAWDWKENDLGITGSSEGVMAHLIFETNPEAVSTDQGFILVDYDKLGFDIKAVA